ncbi:MULTISPECIES: glutathione S-transferase [Methylobacterium]|jgi:glutathione S-transferase|uniref:glutathione S-transferase family protein n=1 Tax=Methylobacterium TaxID=407 RepID=UPI0008E736DD|nr:MULTISPECIES: glutathione S-transferase [Methylobacterium]MBZ6414094.1 glutathione S-transferase [Methylobacterium sp.]MBK3397487.1 glutathione S-transferase [Methylobacterium ajmalii]MBK3409087.1 glutathione S-transferase [Methylobacterium ajmalii]MBK3424915.1 glutathione S-transferase [Methylobacterium ajmalii]SFF62645.1 Glutathione S-transferase [Methylobacterium sp. yr596]
MKLHHCVGARSFRPLWALEALGLPYELAMLPFPPRVHAKEYFALNPLGTIPLLEDGEVRMTESAAICEYLAARHGAGGLGVRPDEPDYGRYLNALHFGEATLTFPQTLVLRYGRFEPPERRNPGLVEDYSRWFLSRLKGFGAVLGERPFIAAGRFTAADISVGYALMLAEFAGLGEQLPDFAKTYWAGLQAEPSYARALAAERRAAGAQGVSPVPSPLGG